MGGKKSCTYGSSVSLSVSLSAPPLSVGGLSLVGGGHDGDPLSGSGGPVRSSLTRATPQRGSETYSSKSLVCQLEKTVMYVRPVYSLLLDEF